MARLVKSVNSPVVLPVEDSESVKVEVTRLVKSVNSLVVLPVEDSQSVKVVGDETGQESELAGAVAG